MAGLVSIGFGNMINTEKVSVVISPDAAPVKRMVQAAKTEGTLIDATQGRKTKSVIVLETGQIVLSALQSDTIARRFTERISEEPAQFRGDEDE